MVLQLLLALPMAGVGFGLWTLFEYVTHRWVFHMIMLRDHALHHQNPAGFIGVPNFVSLSVLAVFAAPIFVALPAVLACEILLGLVLGYVWYLTLHDRFHRSSWLFTGVIYKLRQHHDLHHRWASKNFGVTTRLWDKVFNTIG
jgi:sterol desaturase/sphingolipid hydroxylase (fatty acid hydroxylase superfamily)